MVTSNITFWQKDGVSLNHNIGWYLDLQVIFLLDITFGLSPQVISRTEKLPSGLNISQYWRKNGEYLPLSRGNTNLPSEGYVQLKW